MFLPLAAAMLLAVAPAPVVHPTLERPTLHPGATPTPNALYDASHTRIVYGTIVSIREKTDLVVRLRNGIAQRVDATEAIRTGRFSAPLFVGKIVAVTGHLQPTGILTATTIQRAPSLKQMPEDRFIIPVPTASPRL